MAEKKPKQPPRAMTLGEVRDRVDEFVVKFGRALPLHLSDTEALADLIVSPSGRFIPEGKALDPADDGPPDEKG